LGIPGIFMLLLILLTLKNEKSIDQEKENTVSIKETVIYISSSFTILTLFIGAGLTR
jgi:hypothetical protein